MSRKTSYIILLVSILITVCSISTNAATTIMPVGDSITQGNVHSKYPIFKCDEGYRRPLYKKLDTAGYFVNFVGQFEHPEDSCPSMIKSGIDFDRDHQSEYGKRAKYLTDINDKEIYEKLEENLADIVLLHTGTMDLIPDSRKPSQVVKYVMQILDKIDKFEKDNNHDITVLLALILDSDNVLVRSKIAQFNDELEQAANIRIANGDRITIVNIYSGAGINYKTDMSDWSHPNEVGYSKMADAWYNALVLTLGNPAHPLAFWESRTSGVFESLKGITYSNGIAVAVGEAGTIITSSNGKTWTNISLASVPTLRDVAYGNSKFVAVGHIVVTSIDGVTWVERDSGTNEVLWGIAFGNGTFVATGDDGTIFTSVNGESWTMRLETHKILRAVAYGNGVFVAVGKDGRIFTSRENGRIWTQRALGTTDDLGSVVYGNNEFIAVGRQGTILASTNGDTWSKRVSGTSSTLYGVTFGNGIYVAVGFGGIILTSNNGIKWTQRTSGTDPYWYNLLDVGYVDGTFVAIGNSGKVQQVTP